MAGNPSGYSTPDGQPIPPADQVSGAISPKSLRFDPVDTVHYPSDPNLHAEDSASDVERSAGHGASREVTEGLVTQQQEPRSDHHKPPHKTKKKKKRRRRAFKDMRLAGSVMVCGRLRLSRWIAVSLTLLFVSTLIFLVAFVTNGWGTLTVRDAARHRTTASWRETTTAVAHEASPGAAHLVEPWVAATAANSGDWVEEYWEFGLWQCCRNSDGVCLGTRWPLFYSVTRAFCVLALFGHCLSLAWLVGNSLEQLLDYDVCTLATLATLCFGSGTFVLVAVCCFGSRWPVDFRDEYYGTHPVLSFSFYLACLTVPLTLAAGAFIVVDIQMGLKEIEESNSGRKDDQVNIIDEHCATEQGMDDVRGYGATYKSGFDALEGSLEMVDVSR